MSARETGAVELKPCRIFGETEARQAWISAEQVLLESYVDEYEMCCDDGYYTPTEQERELIRDALQGFVVEHDDLLATHLALNSRPQPTPSATGEIVERLRDGEWWQTVVRGPNPTSFATDQTVMAREAAALIEQQAAITAERDARIEALEKALERAIEAMTCGSKDGACYCPNCDSSFYGARDEARATIERRGQ